MTRIDANDEKFVDVLPRQRSTRHSRVFAPVAVSVVCLFLGLSAIVGCNRTNEPALLVYCAAVARAPMEQLAEQYEIEHGVPIELQFGGSNTLLSKAALSGVGDVFLAADTSYLDTARERSLAYDRLPVAVTRPVLVVNRSAAERVQRPDDLLQGSLRVALANSETAALGRATEQVFRRLGKWDEMKRQVERHGVFTPTAPAVASAVALGGADAGVTWRVLADRFDGLVVLEPPELATERGTLAVAVLTSAADSAAAEAFATYVADPSRGGAVFDEHGFKPLLAGGSAP